MRFIVEKNEEKKAKESMSIIKKRMNKVKDENREKCEHDLESYVSYCSGYNDGYDKALKDVAKTTTGYIVAICSGIGCMRGVEKMISRRTKKN